MVGGEISLGRFRLDLARRELRRDNRAVRLGSRALDILCLLASAEGAVVTKDELMARVWGGVVVEENNLQVHISALRKALEEGGNDESWIVTVPGRGYRLLRSPDPPVADTSAPAPGAPLPDKPSVAVLPFQNMSGDPEQEYFADGMVEEIITALSRIRWLLVIARNSSFTYKGQAVDAKQVGRELGVRYVLEGSVRKGGNRVRITAQLIDAGTGAHLWADRFDEPLEDVFDLQDKVASSVAGVIEPALQAAETARSAGRPTDDLTAYDLYLRAYAMVWSSGRRIPEALRLLQLAIARDPRYGPALAWAAICCFRLLADDRSEDREADRLKGADFAKRALEAAGDDPGVLANAAYALAYFGEDIGAMIALVDRALALNPSYARGWHISGVLRGYAGQLDIAIEHAQAAMRLSPRARVGPSLAVIGCAHFFRQRFDEAVPKLLLAIQEDPGNPQPYRYLAACYAHMGRLDDAREVVGRLRAIPAVVIPHASPLRNPEHRELYLSGLRLATGESPSIDAVERHGDRPLRLPESPAADKSDVGPSVPLPDRPSVAVLPFQNMSGDPEQEYFADGMVEEIITALSRIRWLFVTARNSSFTYKGQNVDVTRVGRELGVRYVLEGSVRRSGDRVRITSQLIDAGTGAHLWADHFDGRLEDVFDLQDKVASSVAGVIEPTLQAAETARSTGRPTTDLTAYDLYLRAHSMVWPSARQIPEALGLLEQAIARDPGYGPALAWAAYCCFRLLLDGRSEDPDADRLKGADFARQALEVAGDDPNILANAAQVLSYFGEDIDAMIALVDRALALNPSSARAWHVSGVLRLEAGQLDIVIKHVENSLRLSPRARVGTSLTIIGQAHFLARRFDEAAPKLILAIQQDPSFTVPYRYLAACYAHMGRLAEAREIIGRLRAISTVVIPDVSHLRSIEHRELFLSGLRLAAGESRSIDAMQRRGDRPLRSPEPPAADKPDVGPSVPLPDKPSIAVLRFQNMSGGQEHEYFADGMVEELITALSRFRSLFVIARNSSFTYQDRPVDVKFVGRELGVRYVLEGSVRKAANRVRIIGQLIDATTGTHLWADRFEGTLENIFDLQDQISARVVAAIVPRLEQAEIERVKRKPTENLDAYDYYLRGIAALYRFTSREANVEALQLFKQAIELDRDFASAYGMAAHCYVPRKANDWMADSANEMVEAAKLAQRAMELGGDDALALTMAGTVSAYVVRDLSAGGSLIDRALVLNENLALAWFWGGYVKLWLGEPDAALERFAHVVRLSPVDPYMSRVQAAIADAHFHAERYDEASSWAAKSLQGAPFHNGLRISAASNALAGRLEQAQRAVARLQQLDPELRVSNLENVQGPYRRPEDIARYEEGMRRAGLAE